MVTVINIILLSFNIIFVGTVVFQKSYFDVVRYEHDDTDWVYILI